MWELATDSPVIWRGPHAFVEPGFIVLAVASATLLGRGGQDAERLLAGTRRALAERSAERDAWRARAEGALRGLGEAMDGQFAAWALTPAEKETAPLLLEGYSRKDIAVLGGKSERTVRQHAVSIQRKSGLGGRAGLAAFFFEDMLLPGDVRDLAPAPGGVERGPAV
uniref:Helix-turn-helix transcriptional regulator n=1 Tax=Eiseniibacteriota bacterium TaxID=2212470 RepID=A0A832I189_UNCEI